MSVSRADTTAMPIEHSEQELICGVVAIETACGTVVGTLRYPGGCSEIHDIQVMTGLRRLGISGRDADTTRLAIDMPELGLWLDPEPEDGLPAQREDEVESLHE